MVDYAARRRDSLRDILRGRGLKVSGLKAELVTRLEEDDNNQVDNEEDDSDENDSEEEDNEEDNNEEDDNEEDDNQEDDNEEGENEGEDSQEDENEVNENEEEDDIEEDENEGDDDERDENEGGNNEGDNNEGVNDEEEDDNEEDDNEGEENEGDNDEEGGVENPAPIRKRPHDFEDRRSQKRRRLRRGGSKKPAQAQADVEQADVELVRPRFWRNARAKHTVTHLKAACKAIVESEGQLSFEQQRQLFPYIFWPPPPGWCLVPFELSATTPGNQPGNEELNSLPYGLGPYSGDQIWKHAVLGVFKPQQKHFQLFDDILIPVYFPWGDDSVVSAVQPRGQLGVGERQYDAVAMWGLLHYQKGSDTAYMHVMTEWQQDTFSKAGYNRHWTDKLMEKLTGEDDLDATLFVGEPPRIKTTWVPNLVGPRWSDLGWRGNDMAETGQQSFLYVLFAATQLAIHELEDGSIPQYAVDEALEGLAQALLGASTALEHGSSGKSVAGGIRARVPRDAPVGVRAHRQALDVALNTVTTNFTTALGSDTSSNESGE